MNSLEQQRLITLLTEPRESLHIEYKSWIDLSSNHGKATIAKAAIALANSGGGTIVLGMREDASDKATPKSKPRPSNISRYDVAVVNAAVNRYADPKLDCEIEYANHPDTNEEHAFVVIPSNVSVPVMSTRDSGDVIRQQTCYIRKPGPKSEPPYTSEEWRKLLDRCVRSSRQDMLDSIRAIVLGQTDAGQTSPTDEQALADFVSASRERWRELVSPLSDDDVARLSYGAFEFCFSLPEGATFSSLIELRDIMDSARKIGRTSYEPFWHGTKEALHPRIVEGSLEAWMGNPDGRQRSFLHAFDCSFWRATLDGRFYHLEAMYEDLGVKGWTPGTLFEIAFNIKRVGAFLTFSAEVAQLLGDVSDVVAFGRYSGLPNRSLFLERDIWQRKYTNISPDNSGTFGPSRIKVSRIQDNLEETVLELLRSLYERFSYFELSQGLVAQEIENMRQGRW